MSKWHESPTIWEEVELYRRMPWTFQQISCFDGQTWNSHRKRGNARRSSRRSIQPTTTLFDRHKFSKTRHKKVVLRGLELRSMNHRWAQPCVGWDLELLWLLCRWYRPPLRLCWPFLPFLSPFSLRPFCFLSSWVIVSTTTVDSDKSLLCPIRLWP